MRVALVRWTSLVSTAITLCALAAHVLELPNKLRLDGALWLAVQQSLYRGWGPVIGPIELTAIASTWILLFLVYRSRVAYAPTLLAALLLSAALAVFFALNVPVNAALTHWTAQTLPPDWADHRLRWETGHALGFALVLVAFIALLRAKYRDAIEDARDGRGR